MAGCLVSALSHAQIRKGSLLFGGSVGYTSQEQTTTTPISGNYKQKITTLLLSPSFATAISDNLFIGADLTWTNSKQKSSNSFDPSTTEQTNYAKGGGVFVRKYWSIVDKLYVFGQGRLGFQTYRNDIIFPEPPNYPGYRKGNTFQASFYPGLSFALSKKVHLESTFLNLVTFEYDKGSDYNKASGTKVNKYSNFGVNSSFDNATTFTLGVKVLLSK